MNRFRLTLFPLFLFWLLIGSAHAAPFDPGHVGFAVTIEGDTLAHRNFFATTLPRQHVALRFEHGADPAAFAVRSAQGKAKRADTGWSWRAPATPGIYPLTIEHRIHQRVRPRRRRLLRKDSVPSAEEAQILTHVPDVVYSSQPRPEPKIHV